MKKVLLVVISALILFSFCACGSDEQVTPDGMKVAGRDNGNDAVQYTFFYPETWEIVRDTATIEIKFDCNESTAIAEYATISVVGFELTGDDAELTARQYWNDKYKSEVKGLYDNFEIEKEDGEEISLDETPAIELSYTGDLNGHKYYCNQVICVRYGTAYLITLVVPDENKDKVAGALDTVVKDFKFDESIF